MLGPFDYSLWLISFLAEVYVVVRTVLYKEFLRYLTLNLYLLALAVNSVSRFVILRVYGFGSLQYRYFYYYTDALVTVIMFVAIIELYSHAFEEMDLSRDIRRLAIVILGAAALFSLLVVERNRTNLTGRFVVELAQNLYFIGTLMTYALWAIMLMRQEARRRLLLIVTAFGIFFSLHAVTYALRSLFPALVIWHVIPPLVGTWLPVSLSFTFAIASEEARVATRFARGIW